MTCIKLNHLGTDLDLNLISAMLYKKNKMVIVGERKINMKYLVTGSDGFIGSHLLEKLKKSGEKVIECDLNNGQDLCDTAYAQSLPDVDVIFHLAAVNGTWKFYEKPWEVGKNNILPTLNLLERYRGSSAKFVFASTCEIFNGSVDSGVYSIPTDEKVPVMFNDITNPRWSYSIPKALGENLVANSGLPFLILRYFNIYGPRQRDHFISEFYDRHNDGSPPTILGNDTRSFCYVDDAVNMTIDLAKIATDEILNIGRQEEILIKDVAELILKICKIEAGPLRILPSPVGSVTRRCPDMSKTLKILDGFEYTPLQTGLEKTINNYKKGDE